MQHCFTLTVYEPEVARSPYDDFFCFLKKKKKKQKLEIETVRRKEKKLKCSEASQKSPYMN